MSLKGGMSDTEIRNTIDDAKKGKKKAINKLSDRYQKGYLSTEEYNKILTEYHTNKSRKIKIILCIVLVLSLASVAVVYHNNAIEDAFNEGNSIGYSNGKKKGYSDGYDKGYDKGYSYYEKIKNEYNFYHKSAVIVTTTGKKYHKYNCYHIKNRNIYIYNIENAEVKGYTPCLDCYD